MNSTTCTDSNSSDEDDMKKLLIASTALSLAGGAALAEISVSGDAELGVDYNSEAGEGMSKHSFVHEVGIDFSGSGTTDGGLSFGGSAGFDTNDDTVNLGTVHVSGSFGTLTIGDNDPASFAAGGIADIGLNGIGVDDVAEGPRKGTNAALRYDNSFGQVSIAISAGTKDGSAAVAEIPGSAAVDATLWTIIGYGANDEVRIFTADPTMYGTNAADAATVSVFDRDVGVFRAIDDDGAVTAVSSFDDTDGTATTTTVITGFMKNEEGTVRNADDSADASVAESALFNSYIEAYELGADGVVGGADDMRKGGVVINNAVAAGDPTPAVPAVKSKTEYAFGMSFETGGVTIGVGYDSNKTISMGAGFSAGEISTNLLYVKTDEEHDDGEMTGMGADVSYSMGASTVTLAYGREKPEMGAATTAVGMGVTHDLGGGATMNAGFGKVADANKASIGIGFKF